MYFSLLRGFGVPIDTAKKMALSDISGELPDTQVVAELCDVLDQQKLAVCKMLRISPILKERFVGVFSTVDPNNWVLLHIKEGRL